MEETLFEKLKTKYIVKNIFKYFKDKNFKYKLIKYSKKTQKFLGIDVKDYKRKIKKNDIKLYISENFNNKFFLDFNQNSIDGLMSRYGIEDGEKLKKYLLKAIIQFINNKIDNDDDYGKNFYFDEIPIYIHNIFFNDLIEEKFFNKLFTIIIPTNIPEKHLLLLKEKNIKYSSIRIVYEEIKRLNYFDELNINFEQIKKLGFYGKNLINSNYRIFFEKFFSIKNLQNNLIYLNIEIKSYPINPNIFENINNFKSLEQLHLIKFKSSLPLIIELETLKILTLKNCKNIVIGNKSCKNLKEITIVCCKNINNGLILVLPNLESFKVHLDPCFNYNLFHKIIDFKSSQKLKYLIADSYDFIKANNKQLVDVKLRTLKKNYKFIDEKKLLTKLIEMPYLKIVDIELKYIKDDDFEKIKGINDSVEIMNINFRTNKPCKFYDLEKKFINLKHLTINSDIGNLTIKENKDCKVTKFTVVDGGEFYINSFENLIMASFLYCEIIPKSFPFFSMENIYEFKSLVSLELIVKELDYYILENILKNIDKSPKLEKFVLSCSLKEYNENKYKAFIINLLSKKLIIIDITDYEMDLNRNFYSNDELKLLYPSFIENKYKKLLIQKIALNEEEKNMQYFNFNLNAPYYNAKNHNYK